MKKWIATLLALTLALAAALPATAEQPARTLEGFVTELTEGGFVMEDIAMGEVLLNTDGQTVWDGALVDEPLEVGQYVFVDYDGKLTRSIPPQAHADRVGCYILRGTAGEISPDGVLLHGDAVFGDVLVRLDAAREHIFEGVPMTVYYNGIMAMSLPGQVGASAVIVPMLEGVADEIDEQGFTLATDDGQSYRVELDEGSLLGELAQDDDVKSAPVADAEGASADAEADDTETDDTETDDTETDVDLDGSTDAADSPALAPGDRVRVYFSGEYLSDEEDAVLALEALILRP